MTAIQRQQSILPAIQACENTPILERTKAVRVAKERLVEQSQNNKPKRWTKNAILIGGDFFSAVFLAFQGIKTISPITMKVAAVALTSSVFGFIGGGINISVGAVSVFEGIRAMKNGDNKKAAQLLTKGFLLMLLGSAMLLISLSHFVSLGALGTFIAANPWIIPVLALLIAIPVLIEVVYNNQMIQRHTDIASKFNLEKLAKDLKTDPTFKEIQNNFKDSILDIEKLKYSEDLDKDLIAAMEKLQAEYDPNVAISTFKLFEAILAEDKAEVEKTLGKVNEDLSHWKKVQRIRAGQQTLIIAAFVVSILALGHFPVAQYFKASQSFALTGSSTIAFGLDGNPKTKYQRNTPEMVASVEKKHLDPALFTA